MENTAELVKQTWSRGQYTKAGTKLVMVSEQLCETMDLHAGKKVLDVATGHGNTALAAARRECDVTAIDTVNSLMETGRERAKAEGLTVHFMEGDAEHISFPDEHFDYVLSTFGVQFIPNGAKAARELIRVCKSKGSIGLVNWTATGFLSDFNDILSDYVPHPDIASPYLWGERGFLQDFFGDFTHKLKVISRAYVYRFPTPEMFLDCFRTTYGPYILAYESQSKNVRIDLKNKLLKVIHHYNRAEDGTLILPIDYVEVIAEKI
ncbi:MAG TPA: class I SAM-dependent methyltransferase [Balneolales bacterium]|nr:class I SAM-dependent methyltransferase [Balneolales bacterium]